MHVCLHVCSVAGKAPDYSSARVRRSIQDSLARLGVDYIDVLHCHDIEFCPDMRQVCCVHVGFHSPCCCS
jgi:aryl-alcohol dehydrogenase-like predicted oxidoreductase